MSADKEKLCRIVQNHLRKRRWDIIYRLHIEIAPTDSLVEAAINREDWTIYHHIDPDIEKRLEKLIEAEHLLVERATEKTLCATADHEDGHWSICPFDRDDAERILYGIATGLKKRGLTEEEIIQYTPDVANIFADYIDNTVKGLHPREGRDFSEGIGLFYLNQITMPSCTPGYLLFVDAQMKAYGDKTEYPINKRSLFNRIKGKTPSISFRTRPESHPLYKKIEKDAQRLTATVLPKTLAEKAYAQPLDAYDARLVTEELIKRNLWEKKAEAFAEVFAPYAKQACEEQGNGSGKEDKGNGKQEQGKEDKGNGKQKQGKECKDKKHGRCGFFRKMLEDPDTRKEIIKKALERGGRKHGAESVPYIPQLEAFEAIYERAAQEIVINYFKEKEEQEQPVFNLFYMQDRALDEDDKLQGKIHWSKTMFVPTPEGQKPVLYQQKVPYQIQEGSVVGNVGLEDILFVVDTSGSMGWTREPLDGSPYDLSLRSIFGVTNGLEQLQRAAHARFGLVLFGTETVFSGWKDYANLGEFKREVFTGYQNAGDTIIHSDVMKQALDQNKDRFLTLIISDGEVRDPQQTAQIFKQYIDAGNDVVQFSIGGLTQFSHAIKKYGADVIPVGKPEDLIGIVLEKSLGRYT